MSELFKLPLVYLIGEPGSGKTSAARAMLQGWCAPRYVVKPFKFMLYEDVPHINKLLVLGHYDRAFGGTDTLSYSVLPLVKQYLTGLCEDFQCRAVFGEGDRLANDSAFDYFAQHFDFRPSALSVDPEVGRARRAARGTNQDAIWVKGRRNKVARLASLWHARQLDANSANPAQLGELLLQGYEAANSTPAHVA